MSVTLEYGEVTIGGFPGVFVDFLHREGVTRQYLHNLMNVVQPANSCNVYTDRTDQRFSFCTEEHLIWDAFLFSHTQESYDYWVRLHRRWLDTLENSRRAQRVRENMVQWSPLSPESLMQELVMQARRSTL